MPKIGMITIGQAPRSDIVPEMAEILGEQVEIFEAGALDPFSLTEVEAFKPAAHDTVLVSRMRDGTEVLLAKEHILPFLQERITLLEGQGVETILLLCTGKFPAFQFHGLLLYPQPILLKTVEGILPQGKLGILSPTPAQILQSRQKWSRAGIELVIETASPYGKDHELANAAVRLRDQHLDLIVMDCMGYREAMRQEVKTVTGKPVILSNALVARVVKELL
jgi:protein AroM